MTVTVFPVLGTLGVCLIVMSYLLLTMGCVSNVGIRYFAANALGAMLIIISLADSFNMPALLIEVFWLAISLLGIIDILRGTRTR